MTLSSIIDTLAMMETALWAVALICFFNTKARYEMPALALFFTTHLLGANLYPLFRHISPLIHASSDFAYVSYFWCWWVIYIGSALAAFLVIQQIIRAALAPLPGLSSLGVLFFRWAGWLTIVIAITAHLADIKGGEFAHWMTKLLISFALCMCLFEVSLLALLALTARLLGLSFRSRAFGISLGLALLGITEFFNLALTANGGNVVSYVNLGGEMVTLGALLTLVFYIARPEPVRGVLAQEKASQLMRWNQIVREMGVGPPLPVERVPNFMEEVETLVDRILRDNAVGEI